MAAGDHTGRCMLHKLWLAAPAHIHALVGGRVVEDQLPGGGTRGKTSFTRATLPALGPPGDPPAPFSVKPDVTGVTARWGRSAHGHRDGLPQADPKRRGAAGAPGTDGVASPERESGGPSFAALPDRE